MRDNFLMGIWDEVWGTQCVMVPWGYSVVRTRTYSRSTVVPYCNWTCWPYPPMALLYSYYFFFLCFLLLIFLLLLRLYFHCFHSSESTVKININIWYTRYLIQYHQVLLHLPQSCAGSALHWLPCMSQRSPCTTLRCDFITTLSSALLIVVPAPARWGDLDYMGHDLKKGNIHWDSLRTLYQLEVQTGRYVTLKYISIIVCCHALPKLIIIESHIGSVAQQSTINSQCTYIPSR